MKHGLMYVNRASGMKKILKICLILLGIVFAIVLAYGIYVAIVYFTYTRIEDQVFVPTDGTAAYTYVETEKEYTIATYNIGFGAYTPEFTFFMDGGHESWAFSEESVLYCMNGAMELMEQLDPDFILFQEVDSDSTRSYHIDEQEMLREKLQGYSSATAQNYHSAFLMYPLYQPHGASNSGIMTLSDVEITSSLRRSLPIADGFGKLLDYDRCYEVSRIPVENGKELVLYNVHLSAYGGSDAVRSGQMSMLFGDMEQEYKEGNYVICGGDFNHDFTGTSVADLNPNLDTSQETYGWVQPFPNQYLPAGLTRALDYSKGAVEPTCRNCDLPYEEGNFVVVVDGFILSDNVEITYLENIQTGFAYSDHNPVEMKFVLK